MEQPAREALAMFMLSSIWKPWFRAMSSPGRWVSMAGGAAGTTATPIKIRFKAFRPSTAMARLSSLPSEIVRQGCATMVDSSPSLIPSASASAFGSRRARLFPHFETCMMSFLRIYMRDVCHCSIQVHRQPETDAMGRLSTHVLDTVKGGPARGVRITLHRLEGPARAPMKDVLTNADGRTDEPLMLGESYRPGSYELEFHIGAYFAATGAAQANPPFLDVVPVRFSIAETDGHYHVPLLCSPWAYSTYRGS
jgi:5-hydroxyisourate hydrolase